MAWSFPRQDFQHVTDLAKDPECTLDALAQESDIREAFRQGDAALIPFLLAHLDEIIDIALGEKEGADISTRAVCVYFLSTNCPVFSAQLSCSPLFLGKMTEFISKSGEFSIPAISTFCRAMEVLTQHSRGFVFKYLPEPDIFLTNVIQKISYLPVASFLEGITENVNQAILDFLREQNATHQLFEMFGDDERANASILAILTNIASMELPNATLIECLLDEAALDKLFSFCVGDSVVLSSLAFNLMLELCACCEDREELFTDVDPRAVINFVMRHMSDITGYIEREGSFTTAKARGGDLLIEAISCSDEVPDCVYSLLRVLFEKMFENPVHSSLHCTLLGITGAVEAKDKGLFQRFDVRQRIVDAFAKRNTTVAMYWGHLFKLAEMVVDAEVQPQSVCDGWDAFIDGPYESMRSAMEAQYGGPLPHSSSSSFQTDDDDALLYFHKAGSDDSDEFESYEEDSSEEKLILIDFG